MSITNTIGRRKAAVARIYMKKGNGSITINGRDFADYFPVDHMRLKVMEPMRIVEVEGEYDIKVNLNGGGVKGQAEAMRLAISRGLCEINAEFRPPLKSKGLLTRDARVVERKKPGLRKARKKEQYSKR